MKPYGYGTIRLPRAGIKPLQMLTKSGGKLTPIGPISGTFQAGAAPLPVPRRDRVTNLSGSEARDVRADIGVDILGTVIGALSGSALGVKAAYRSARSVSFEFGDVMENVVEITELDQFLSSGSVAGAVGNYLKDLLENDEVFCIVSTVDAHQINVEGKKEDNSSLGVEVPVIQQLVGGKVSVSSSGSSSTKLTYTSTETPLPFGLKAVRLFVKDRRYTTMKIVEAGNSNLSAALTNAEDAEDNTAIFAVDLED